MKKIYLTAILALFVNCTFSSSWIKTAIFQNNIWYPWEEGSGMSQSGTWDCFTVHSSLYDPSKFYFRITIENFSIPDKKVRKDHIKRNEWYKYSGYIEYWIDDDHMNFLSTFPNTWKLLPDQAVPWMKYDGRPSIIKKSRAEIQIQPYEKTPVVYNIWFEGIGYAFCFFQKHY